MNRTAHLLACLLVGHAVASDPPLAEIREGFASPPDAAKPHTLWHWMNGHIGREAITRDLESMKAAGLGGFMLWNASEGIPPGPVRYMSLEWWDLFRHTVNEAERLGLQMSVFNCAGWSSSGGPWVTPERAMQEVVWTEKQVAGPTEFDGVLETPIPALGIERDMRRDPEINKRYYVPREKVRGHYHDIRLVAFPTTPSDKTDKPWRLENWREKAGFAKFKKDPVPDTRPVPPGEAIDPGSVIDLTDKLDKDGRLRWSVPPGEWTLLRIGYQPTGRQNHPAPVEGTGLEIDKQTAAAVDFHWEQSIAKMLEAAGDKAGRVFRGIHIDSFEVGHQNWSSGFAAAFRAERGYDVHPHLIALTGRVLRSTGETEDFLWDFRKTTSDLIARNYYGRFAELCHRNGLELLCEPYGKYGNTDDFAVASIPDIPMCEWWAFRDEPYHTATAKLASSAAHTRGRAIVDSEAFTGTPERIFEEHPASMKAQGDFFLCQGINRFSFHTFAHDPYEIAPGLGLGSYGSRFDRRNTWWPFLRPWMEYLARCQYLLRQGTFVADFLYYTGEDAPKSAKLPSELSPPPPAGFDFDFCDTTTLMELAVRDGRLVLPSGMSYRALVLPQPLRMSGRVQEKLAALTDAGAVLIDPKAPSLPPMPPDFSFEIKDAGDSGPAAPDNGVEAIHRRTTDADIYFVSNQHDRAMTVEAVFRVTGRRPELWHPETGQIESAISHRETEDGRTAVTLHLDPAGSVFVIFPSAPTKGIASGVRERISGEMQISGPWHVAFQPGRGAPALIALDELIDLSKHPDAGVKYFSGNATYRTHFDFAHESGNARSEAFLDLGGVEVIASVRLNGKDLGIAWKPPFRVEATGALREGRNELEIVVANLWGNRLVGDRALPDDSGWTAKTGSTAKGEGLARIPEWVAGGGPRPSPQRAAFAAWRWPHLAEKELLPSGLLGPVRLIFQTQPLPEQP